MEIFLAIVFVILMIIGTPIGLVLGLTGLFGLVKLGAPGVLGVLSQHFFSAMDNYALVAMPLFYLAGEIMNNIKVTERLVDLSNLLVGRLRGGLAHVQITTSVIFGGISGSAVADITALGSIFIPSMTKQGYGKEFATGLCLASSIIAPIIPPSIIMVIYGAFMGVSIAGLFAAGVVPGLMIGLGLIIISSFIAKKRNFPIADVKLTFRNLAAATKRAAWALIIPIVILGGILGGMVTPTEAAAIAVGYVLFLGFFVYRNLKLRDLYSMFFRVSVSMGVVCLILSSAAVLAWLLAGEQIPEKVALGFKTLSSNKYVILLLINLFLLIVGCLMDIIAALLLLAPVLAPLAISVGVHPLHFGVMMCINLTIGLVTPPVGGCLFVAMTMTRLSMESIVKAFWPFLLVEIIVLFLVVYIPPITMYLPTLLGFGR